MRKESQLELTTFHPQVGFPHTSILPRRLSETPEPQSKVRSIGADRMNGWFWSILRQGIHHFLNRSVEDISNLTGRCGMVYW